MDDVKKDSPDEASSTSSNTSKKEEQNLSKLQQMRMQLHGRQKSLMILEQMAPREQKEFAHDMYSQMRQLKEHNEAMGYHGYSAYLRRHSNQQASTEFETEVETDTDCDLNTNTKPPKTHPRLSKHHKRSHSIVLPETAALKQKLDNISASINQMRHDLSQQRTSRTWNSGKKQNDTIMYFQNQLTDIQDQIEDAENDIESNIDIKVLRYQQDIKLNKQKLKSMKKEKKEKEKREQIQKQKEQEKIIELQQLQIGQLMVQNSNSPRAHDDVLPEVPVIRRDDNNNLMNEYRPLRLGRANTSRTLPIQSMRASQSYRGNMHKRYLYKSQRQLFNSYSDEVDEEEYIAMVPSPGSAPNVDYPYSEGYQMQKQQRPFLDDETVTIIGGVVIILAGLWMVTKYFDHRNNGPPARGKAPSKRW